MRAGSGGEPPRGRGSRFGGCRGTDGPEPHSHDVTKCESAWEASRRSDVGRVGGGVGCTDGPAPHARDSPECALAREAS
eukprot:2159742-Pleurochrysis_carterae.AAC.2